MAGEAVKSKASYGGALPSVFKVGLINFMAGSALTAGAAVAGKSYAAGFAAGYFIGFLNLLWLLSIVRKSAGMNTEKVIKYFALRYYARFLITAGLIVFLVSRKFFAKPWTPVMGITVSIFIAVGALIILAKEELK